jgi:3-phenylpropionate/trans-cinnamate dioxygenase ferredoxin component
MAFQRVARLDDIPPGRVEVVDAGDQEIALCNVEGTLYAIDNVCTHDSGPLDQGELEGNQIECPRHGARFDVRTGRALTLPAVRGVHIYPVEVRDGGEVYVDPDA